jgi:hypothetical protein
MIKMNSAIPVGERMVISVRLSQALAKEIPLAKMGGYRSQLNEFLELFFDSEMGIKRLTGYDVMVATRQAKALIASDDQQTHDAGVRLLAALEWEDKK